MAWMDGGWRYLGVDRRGGCAGRSPARSLAGLAWQGAAIAAPLLIRRARSTRGIVARQHARALVGVRRRWSRSERSRRSAGALRHYFAIRNRARGRRGRPRRDLPPRPGAGRPLPRPRRRGRADLARLERRGAGRARSSTRSGTRSATCSRSSARRGRPGRDRLARSRSPCSRRCRCSASASGATRSATPQRTKINQEQLAERRRWSRRRSPGSASSRASAPGGALAARFRRQSDEVVRTALDVADVDAVFLPALEALPLIGHPRRALVRRPPRARRRRSRSARSRCSTSTSRCS